MMLKPKPRFGHTHRHTHTHPQPHELEIDRKPNGMKKIPTFIKSDMKEKKSILSSKS